MSDKLIITRPYASATLNLGGSEGKIVKEGALGVLRLGTSHLVSSNQLLGVVWSAENQNGGDAGVVVSGRCKVIAGATFTPGTHTMLFTCDASGLARPASATGGSWVVGRILSTVAVAANDVVDCVVYPHVTEPA